MMRSATATGLNPEFNKFLRAPVDEDGNGMRLSVLSALARLDLDPWQEATNLSTLPRETAIQRLASLIGGLPDTLSIRRNPVLIASRLITLLPNKVRYNIPLHEAPPDSGARAVSTKLAFVILFFIFLTSVIASQYIEGTRPSILPKKDESARATTASTPDSSPNLGR